MADNFPLTPGSGRNAATDQVTHSGDSADVQLVRPVLTTGSEGSKTVVDLTGDNTNGLDVDVTRVGGNVTVVQPTASNLNVRVENITGTVSLPTGAATAAKQPALGTAGTASADVITVQGVASMTPLQVSDGGGSLTIDAPVGTPAFVRLSDGASAISTLPVSLASVPSHAVTNAGTFAVQNTAAIPAGSNAIGTVTAVGAAAEDAAASGNPVLIGGRYDSAARTLETGDVGAIALNASGQVLVEIAAGAGSGGTSAADGATFTRNTTSITPAGAVVESSAPTLNNGDVAGLSQDTSGNLRVRVEAGGIEGIAEDTASAGGEEGLPILAVRRDAASSGVGADGDFAFLSVTSDGSLRVSGSAGTTQYAEDAAHTTGDSLCVVGAVRRDTAAVGSGTDGDYSTLNVNSSGRLYTSSTIDAALPAGANTIGAVNIAAAQTLATVTTVSTVTNVATIGTSVTPGTSAAHLGKAEDAAHSSGDTGVMSLAVRTDTAAASSGTTGDYEPLHTDSVGALWTRSTGELADDAAFTAGTSRVVASGHFADETATDSVDEGDVGASRMTLDRKQIVTEYVHAAAGGGSSYSALSTAAVLAAEIKGSAGKVYSLQLFNNGANEVFVRLYNQTGSPANTDTANIVWRGMVPGNTSAAGFAVQFPKGKQFSSGIGIRVTAAVADNDNTSLSANEVMANVDYA